MEFKMKWNKGKKRDMMDEEIDVDLDDVDDDEEDEEENQRS